MKIKVHCKHLMMVKRNNDQLYCFKALFSATKSGEGFNTSGENNFQRSMIVQSSALFSGEETDMTSADWLKIFGIDAQKLDFFSILQSAAFRHCDGVVTLLKPPGDSDDVTAETPAVSFIFIPRRDSNEKL